jgi:tetratricopeptide (TPR) repeat protein
VTENNSMAENFLANELFELGRYQEGMMHLRKYTQLEPLDPSAHARVGADYQDHEQIADAIHEYKAAIRAAKVLSSVGEPGLTKDMLAMTYANLAVSYAQLGDEAKAQENTRKAVDVDPDAVGKMVSGLAQYLPAHPSAQGYVRLGLLCQQIGHGIEAQQAFAKARQLNPQLRLPVIAEAFQQ